MAAAYVAATAAAPCFDRIEWRTPDAVSIGLYFRNRADRFFLCEGEAPESIREIPLAFIEEIALALDETDRVFFLAWATPGAAPVERRRRSTLDDTLTAMSIAYAKGEG